MAEQIVVVGGGAGGLELVVKLARKYRKSDSVSVCLVDCNPTHIWKPLLHEVATGTLNSNHDETSYLMLARKHGFVFVLGRVSGVDTTSNSLQLQPIKNEHDDLIVDSRELTYTKLILAVGSLCNDFGTQGVVEHCLLLDTRAQAERFHSNFINQLHRLNASDSDASRLSLVIVGAGATGVELAADLHKVAKRLPEYGFDEFSIDRLRVMIVEAAPRILAQLPERVSVSVTTELEKIGVEVRVNTMVKAVEADTVLTGSGEKISAQLVVWAAGIRAPEFLKDTELPTDKIGRVLVDEYLRVKSSENVFAIGDCCACEMADGTMVPPRAQSAHQMASIAYTNIVNDIRGSTMKPFVYKDFGSLISLSEFSTVGNLMGNLMRGTLFIEGWLARMFYLSLYRMHQVSIHGWRATGLIMLGDRIYKATRADIKLH